MTPNHESSTIMDETNGFDDDDDGFTTIKDLAERGITKMEPLDYDDLENTFYFDDYEDGDDEDIAAGDDSCFNSSGVKDEHEQENDNFDVKKVSTS
jgi:hypothetical protein